ncbi:MAG: hypothetical protein OQL11_10630 [Gammaproteobacteria bacterium]|nr:hypothetical protein [Gammaproteobacteria bacterium]
MFHRKTTSFQDRIQPQAIEPRPRSILMAQEPLRARLRERGRKVTWKWARPGMKGRQVGSVTGSRSCSQKQVLSKANGMALSRCSSQSS